MTDCSGGNVKVLEDTVAGIKPSGATRADYGLELAGDITSGRADAKKIVVFFTDGKPTSFSEFDSDVAKGAVTAAKKMKDGKATVVRDIAEEHIEHRYLVLHAVEEVAVGHGKFVVVGQHSEVSLLRPVDMHIIKSFLKKRYYTIDAGEPLSKESSPCGSYGTPSCEQK